MNIPVKHESTEQKIKFVIVRMPSGKLKKYTLPIKRLS